MCEQQFQLKTRRSLGSNGNEDQLQRRFKAKKENVLYILIFREHFDLFFALPHPNRRTCRCLLTIDWSGRDQQSKKKIDIDNVKSYHYQCDRVDGNFENLMKRIR